MFDHVHERLLLPYRIAQTRRWWMGGKPLVLAKEREFSFDVSGSWRDAKGIEFLDHSSSALDEYNHKMYSIVMGVMMMAAAGTWIAVAGLRR